MPRLITSSLCYAALSLLLLGGSHEGGPLRPAAGHAVMVEPRSRPWMEYLKNYNYLPHQVRVYMNAFTSLFTGIIWLLWSRLNAEISRTAPYAARSICPRTPIHVPINTN